MNIDTLHLAHSRPSRLRRCFGSVLLGASGAMTALISLPAPAADQGAERALEEVVVTARKKEESLQNAPLAVSAVTQETLESAFLGDAMGLVQFAPNLIFDSVTTGTAGGGALSIRGISLQDVEKTFDPTVLIHVDGVPLGTNSANVMNLLDVERIEVLRGPQGTLFGKNAVGGVINIYRTKPKLGEWAGKVRTRLEDVGDENAATAEGVLNIPMGETLAAKLNAARVEQPGYYKNITIHGRDGGSEEDRFGVHLLWQPSEAFRAEVQYNDSSTDGRMPPNMIISGQQSVLCAFGVCAAGPDLPFSGDRRRGAGELEQDFSLEQKDQQLDLNWNINDRWSATAIAAHREIDERLFQDSDDSPAQLFEVYRKNEYEQDSVELRFAYDGERLSFTTGYFYWNAELPYWENNVDISAFAGLPDNACGWRPMDAVVCQVDLASAKSKSDSVFFEGDYELTPQWIVTLGGRYIEETKKMTKESFVFGAVTLPHTSVDRTDSDTIYRLGLRWEPLEDVMAYATYSTGFRSGGFSIRSGSLEALAPGYEPETVDNYEVGVKTTLLDRRLRFNASVFRTDYNDMQIELQIPRVGGSGTQDAVANAGAATIQGVEVELTALLTDSISVDFNAGWLDAKYDEFFGQVFADGTQQDDNSDLPLRRAPEWNYTAALNYQRAIGDGRLNGRISYSWRDDYAGTVTDFPGTHVDAFGLLDASIGYNFKQWRVGLFGRNLTDADEYSHTFTVVPQQSGADLFSFATPRPPRTFGLEMTYSFAN